MLRFFFTLIIGFLVLEIASGQSKSSPYQVRFGLDMPLMIAAGAGMGISKYAQRQVFKLSLDEVALLDRSNIPGIDRKASFFWLESLRTGSIWSSGITMASPLLLFFDHKIRADYSTVLLFSAESFLFTEVFSGLFKAMIKRNRPFLFNAEAGIPENTLLDRDARFSFFSRHTAQAATFTFLTAKIYADYNPDSKWKPFVWTAAALLPAVTGYLRYRSGQNFTTDIISGYLIGAGIGLLIPTLHKKKTKD